jgi:hypothetical protein
MRRSVGGILLVLVILSLAPLTPANAATSSGFKPKPQPADCPKNADGTWKYRCLDPDDYAEMTIIKINLQEEIARLKASSRHFGIGCAIGPSVGLTVDENLNSHLVPSIGATCGLAVKF